MAMDQLGMKVADVGFQTANVSKSGNQVGTVSDDFRNLLNSKQEGTKESQDSSQVSKDTKPEKTDEVKDEVKTERRATKSRLRSRRKIPARRMRCLRRIRRARA